MGTLTEMPTLRRCIYATAALLMLFGALFVGMERPLAFRLIMVLGGFFLVFPVDQSARLFRLVVNIRPKSMDYVFSAALDPSEGHIEPDDYTLIGVITEVRKLTNDSTD